MRRGGRGGAAAPASFWAIQFFGQRRSFFWAAAMVGGGCFSIFRRADDVTRTMSKGGGCACECPRGGGGVFQFSGGRMTSRRQCPRGGGACEIPPSGNPVSAPVICVKFWAINPAAPPNQSVPIRLWVQGSNTSPGRFSLL